MNLCEGDIVIIDRKYVENHIEKKTKLYKALNTLGSQHLFISRIFTDQNIIKISKMQTHSKISYSLQFNNYEELTNSFQIIKKFNPLNIVVNASNVSDTLIHKGQYVINTEMLSRIPQIKGIDDTSLEKAAICGIAQEHIYPKTTGRILVEGYFSGVKQRANAYDSECFLGLKDETSLMTIPGRNYREKAISLDLSNDSLLYLPKQPSGINASFEARSITGFGNNKKNPAQGKVGQPFTRLVSNSYRDQKFSPVKKFRPNARKISTELFSSQEELNTLNLTNFFWIWALFIFRDISVTSESDEYFKIKTPLNDEYITEPYLNYKRSKFAANTNQTREQINERSSYLDGSSIYGHSIKRASAIRGPDGTLKVSNNNLLPANTTLEENYPNNSDSLYFLTGDPRANEFLPLLALHTVFVREHNRLTYLFRSNNRHLSSDQAYQAARRVVVALIQSITYNEFLPLIINEKNLESYTGYSPKTESQSYNSFNVIQNFIYSAIPTRFHRLNADGAHITQGAAALADSIYRPDRLTEGGGIEPLLRGASQQLCNRINTDFNQVFLNNNPHILKDLIAETIQKSRDHGIPLYNDFRVALKLPKNYNISSSKLLSIYKKVDMADMFVGAMLEEHIPGLPIGETISCVLEKQFANIRDADRFYYKNILSDEIVEKIEATKLSDIIIRNTDIEYLQSNIFLK